MSLLLPIALMIMVWDRVPPLPGIAEILDAGIYAIILTLPGACLRLIEILARRKVKG